MNFDSVELKKQVEESLNAIENIPNGHKAALIANVDMKGNVQLAFASKMNKNWQLTTNFQYSLGNADKLKAGFNLIRTW